MKDFAKALAIGACLLLFAGVVGGIILASKPLVMSSDVLRTPSIVKQSSHTDPPPGWKILIDNDGDYAIKLPSGFIIGEGYHGAMRSRQEVLIRVWNQYNRVNKEKLLDEHRRTQGREETMSGKRSRIEKDGFVIESDSVIFVPDPAEKE